LHGLKVDAERLERPRAEQAVGLEVMRLLKAPRGAPRRGPEDAVGFDTQRALHGGDRLLAQRVADRRATRARDRAGAEQEEPRGRDERRAARAQRAAARQGGGGPAGARSAARTPEGE